jgi:hypothetical protein
VRRTRVSRRGVDYYPNTRYAEQLRTLRAGQILPLTIRSFENGRYDGATVAGALEYAHSHSLSGILIDLRGNGGGYLHNAAHLLSYFIPTDMPYMITVDRIAWDAFRQTRPYREIIERTQEDIETRNKKLRKKLVAYIHQERGDLVEPIPHYSSQHPLFTGRVVILIDRHTASASEVAASALKSLLGPERCLIIGQKSAGALLTTRTDPDLVVEGFYIHCPWKDFLLPDGTHVEGNGIEPDIPVDDARNIAACLEVAKPWLAAPIQSLVSSSELVPIQPAAPAPAAPQPPVAVPMPAPVAPEQVMRLIARGFVPIDSQWLLTTRDLRILEQNPDLQIGEEVVPAIESRIYTGSNLKLICLANPVTNMPLVRHNPTFSQDRSDLEREGYCFLEFGETVLCSRNGSEFFLYGIRNWDSHHSGSLSLPLDVRNWINNQIIETALK